MKFLANLTFAVVTLLAVPTWGQTAEQSSDPAAELVTDRPDQTESASVVPVGSWQLEIGALFSSDSEAGFDVEVLEVPSTLLRVGVHERIELRLGWAGFVDAGIDGPGGFDADVEGSGDLDVGAKFLLAEGSARRPQVALLVASTLPTGDDEVTGDAYDPSFRFNLDFDVSDRVGAGINVGAEWQTVELEAGRDDHVVSLVYTAVVGRSLGDTVGAFLEIFGSEPVDGPDQDAEVSLDGGFTWLVRPNLQLDASAGVGLASAADDWFVGVGLSVRWPE